MSRLDRFIRRLEAQRACLALAAELIRDVPGPLLELGLGNGRTYDHMRALLPGREIYVFERELAAHRDCIPSAEFLIMGDLRDTLPMMRTRLSGPAALAHIDTGMGDDEVSHRLAAEITPLLAPLLRKGAVVVSEPPMAQPGWHALPLPEGVREGRYHLLRVG